MSKWLFEDWAGRQYDDPAIGLVQPGETREADSAPDGQFWTQVPDDYQPVGNRGLEASSTLGPPSDTLLVGRGTEGSGQPSTNGTVTTSGDKESVSTNGDTVDDKKGDN